MHFNYDGQNYQAQPNVLYSFHIGHKILALLDGSLELPDGVRHQLLLEGGQLAQPKVLLDAVLAQQERRGEVLALRLLGPDKGTLHYAFLPVHGVQQGKREPSTGVGHGEGGGAGSGLGLHHLRAGLLDPAGQGGQLIGGELDLGCALGNQRDDGLPGVTSDDGHVDASRVETFELRHERVCSDNIQARDAKHPVGVVHAMLLHDLRRDRDGGVDRVGDDTDHSLGTVARAGVDQGGHDGGVGVEEVIAGHAGFSGHAGGDHDDVAALQSSTQLVGAYVAGDLSPRLDVAQVRRHPGRVGDIVERELTDQRAVLEQQGERLAYAARRSQHRHPGVVLRRGGEAPREARGRSHGAGKHRVRVALALSVDKVKLSSARAPLLCDTNVL